MPIARRIPELIQNNEDEDLSQRLEIRTLDKFMEDQVAFEHRKYENLKNAILVEEANSQSLFQPQITQKSVEIMEKKR